MVSSNCDEVKIYIADRLVAELKPDRESFPHLQYPPFVTNLRDAFRKGWGDLKLEGYIDGKKVIEKQLSGRGADRQLLVQADDSELSGDGIDATRVVFRVTDEFGSARPLANAALQLSLTGPGEIIGENPFALFGGVGAVWIKTKEATGVIRLIVTHPTLGSKTIQIKCNGPTSSQVVI
jgi:beta-galactosidase